MVARQIACGQERAKIPLRAGLRGFSMCDVLQHVLHGPRHGRLTASVLGSQVDIAKVWLQRGRADRWHNGSAMQSRRICTAHGRTAERDRHYCLRDILDTHLPPRRPAPALSLPPAAPTTNAPRWSWIEARQRPAADGAPRSQNDPGEAKGRNDRP